jgi:hypothetical protein
MAGVSAFARALTGRATPELMRDAVQCAVVMTIPVADDAKVLLAVLMLGEMDEGIHLLYFIGELFKRWECLLSQTPRYRRGQFKKRG